MGYEEAVEAVVTRAEALAEVRKHEADVSDFLRDCGDKSEYVGGDVLAWLGY